MLNEWIEYDWKPWLFEKVPAKYWDVEDNVQLFLEWIANKLNMKRVEDWYHGIMFYLCTYFPVQSSQFSALGGAPILHRYGSLPDVLTRFSFREE